MATLLHELIFEQASRRPEAVAIAHRQAVLDYAGLAQQVQAAACGLLDLGLKRSERVAVYLPKQFETVVALFAAAAAGAVFVPVNPLLKPEQVMHILRDCNVRILITARGRADRLNLDPAACPDLRALVLVDEPIDPPARQALQRLRWQTLLAAGSDLKPARVIDLDMAAILYTSGSTGKPKGVVLSHRNMLSGAYSVTRYLDNRADDRLLAILPFSFDYGLSQLTTAFVVGARAVLMDYLLPRDVITAVARDGITGLAAVPPMWVQLARLDWPAAAVESLRYFTNSGGAMPRATLNALRRRLPETTPYLMYGLTEAFRSTYLPPEEIDHRPDSIGKAIPNAEILVVRADGSPCAPGEPGELVHRGSLVAQGYWNDPDKTAERFRPLPGQNPALPLVEMAVWSGDTVRIDQEGFLYFIGRKDDMIKTSGYRVSPTEIEEVLYDSGLVAEAAALGVTHPALGQAVVAAVKPLRATCTEHELINHCKDRLPNFMVPLQVVIRQTDLPRNANGKIDRKMLAGELRDLFSETTS
ncbi:MAG: acyl-CoA ligase (AMP-forming), exosortase A system-associated [Candidatus Competibacter sp.]|nr:acyl-CoA ligase (AMP-forming), exosortase A system-associated [Candidatus Competibacteraceae bacterium]